MDILDLSEVFSGDLLNQPPERQLPDEHLGGLLIPPYLSERHCSGGGRGLAGGGELRHLLLNT